MVILLVFLTFMKIIKLLKEKIVLKYDFFLNFKFCKKYNTGDFFLLYYNLYLFFLIHAILTRSYYTSKMNANSLFTEQY